MSMIQCNKNNKHCKENKVMSDINYTIDTRKGKYITFIERQEIEYWRNRDEKSIKEIAYLLGRSERTIYREIKRGAFKKWNNKKFQYSTYYSADIAQNKYEYNKQAKGPDMKINRNIELADHIERELVVKKKSPEVIAFELKKNGFEDSLVCARTIRNAIKDGNIFLKVEQGKIIYNKKSNNKKKRKRKAKKTPPNMSIEKRGDNVESREEFGHWEGDLVVGKRKKSAVLLTLTERKTRKLIIKKLPNKKANSVVEALDAIEREFGVKRFRKIFKSITFDNGSEFADYKGMETSINKSKRVDIYYAHPYCSFERGSNENNNRMIRRHIPKGENIDKILKKELKAIEKWINNYPRKIFNYESAEERYRLEI